MDISLFISQILGPVLFVVGCSLLLNPDNFHKIIKETKSNHALVYFGSIFSMAIGVLLLLLSNGFDSAAEIIIFILALAMMVKSIVFLILPDMVKKLTKTPKKLEKMFPATGIVYILVWAYLCYVWYAMYL